MTETIKGHYSRLTHRIAVGSLFFLLGLSFASWASRIPAIREKLHLTDASLGLVLFSIPSGILVTLPLTGWLVHRFGSRKVVLTSLLLYTLLLVGIGFAATIFQLVVCLFFFGAMGNMTNISVNTQALGVENLYKRSIMASFHGLWSMAGFTGAAIGTFMTGHGIEPFHHFLIIAIVVSVCLLAIARFTIREDEKKAQDQPIFAWPERSLIQLGILTFCSMICEGAMFDWSGIYFQKVVHTRAGLIGAGYTAFMCTMATGRFVADRFYNRFGLKFTLQCSGILTCCGLLLAVLVPNLVTAIIGFLLVGFGVSSVVPLVYGVAGKSKVMSPGVALAAVTTIGFFGLLIGPVIIGLISGATNLRISFLVIAFMGLCVTGLASRRSFQKEV